MGDYFPIPGPDALTTWLAVASLVAILLAVTALTVMAVRRSTRGRR